MRREGEASRENKRRHWAVLRDPECYNTILLEAVQDSAVA